MSSFTFYPNNPQSTDNPSQSQALILTNFASIGQVPGSGGSWTTQDHYGFSTGTDGQHQFVRLPDNVTPTSPTGLGSALYSDAGTADTSTSQLFYITPKATFQLNAIRAWGFCNSSGIISSQSVNVSSVTRSGAGQYLVTLTANAVTSTHFAVLVSSTMQNSFTSGVLSGYVITGIGTFQLNFRSLTAPAGIDPTDFSFQVMQI